MSKVEFDIFSLNKTFPSAESIFQTSLKSISKIRNSCLIVLDTNALLVPYSTGSQSLQEISVIFSKLKKANRLFVPAQVAREFARHRPTKLQEVFQQLNRKRNSLMDISIGQYPILEQINDYQELNQIENEINALIKRYRKSLSCVIDHVKEWRWNDPVSVLYRQIFTPEIIVDIEVDEAKVKNELEYRYLHKIPPGYKDGGKTDDGIGDYLIWLTILKLGSNKADVIFISGDEKADWFINSEKQALYPRFELLSEFSSISSGHSFHIMRLSEFLNLQGATENVVNEVKIEEAISYSNDRTLWHESVERIVGDWLLRQDYFNIIRKNMRGFPDFIGDIDEDQNIAVEVSTIVSENSAEYYKIKKHLIHAIEKSRDMHFSKLLIVIVAISNEFPLAILKEKCDAWVYKNNPAAFEIDIIYGFLLDNEFKKANL